MNFTIIYKHKESSLEEFMASDIKKPISNSLLLMLSHRIKQEVYRQFGEANHDMTEIRIPLDETGVGEVEVEVLQPQTVIMNPMDETKKQHA